MPAAPVLVKLLIALTCIMGGNALLRRFLHLGLSRGLTLATLAGTVVLAVWSGHPWLASAGAVEATGTTGILGIARERLLSADNLMLGVVILLVIWLSGLMAATGTMRELVAVVRGRMGKRTAMAVLPAIIGWLPMPGGALFSAPLVGECDTEEEVSPLLKTKINYWFRHVWEYWWPLYPGVLLCIDITGLEVWRFVLLMLPLSLAAIATGWLCLMRKVPREGGAGSVDRSATLRRFLDLISPILVVVATYAVIKTGLVWWNLGREGPALLHLNKYLPMVAGLVLALGLIGLRHRPGWAVWRPVFLDRQTFQLLLLVFAIRVFGAFIEADLPSGASLMGVMRDELAAWHIPVLAIVVTIPFVAGLATGLAIGFVGAGFPVVMGLLGTHPSRPALWAMVVLAFGWGYVGMLLSPVHVCLVVTNRHFDTALQHTLWRLLPATSLMLALVTLYAAGLWWLVPA